MFSKDYDAVVNTADCRHCKGTGLAPSDGTTECGFCNKDVPTQLPKVGDRIELTFMGKDPDPIPVGSQGTVTNVAADVHQIRVDWDNKRSLHLIIGIDRWKVIT